METLANRVASCLSEVQSLFVQQVTSHLEKKEHVPKNFKFGTWEHIRLLRHTLFEAKEELASTLFVKWVTKNGESLRTQSSFKYDQALLVDLNFEMSTRACAPGLHILPLECAIPYAIHENLLHRHHPSRDMALLICAVPPLATVVKSNNSLFSKLRVSKLKRICLITLDDFSFSSPLQNLPSLQLRPISKMEVPGISIVEVSDENKQLKSKTETPQNSEQSTLLLQKSKDSTLLWMVTHWMAWECLPNADSHERIALVVGLRRDLIREWESANSSYHGIAAMEQKRTDKKDLYRESWMLLREAVCNAISTLEDESLFNHYHLTMLFLSGKWPTSEAKASLTEQEKKEAMNSSRPDEHTCSILYRRTRKEEEAQQISFETRKAACIEMMRSFSSSQWWTWHLHEKVLLAGASAILSYQF